MSPVYWKPRYATRSMRERAWARRDLAREQAVRQTSGPSIRERLQNFLRRG